MGTPKTLREAIQNAIKFGPLSSVEDRLVHHIKDFLSQKFGVYYLNEDGMAFEKFKELFERCTAEEETARAMTDKWRLTVKNKLDQENENHE